MTMTCMVNTTAVSMMSKSSLMKNLHNNESEVFVPATKCHGITDDNEETETAIVNDYGVRF